MTYAKISSDGTVLVYPYTWSTMYEDNPSTAYDVSLNIKDVFDTTDSHIVRGENLVEVGVEEVPQFDPNTQTISISDIPVKDGDVYLLKHTITTIPEGEAISRVDDLIRFALARTDWTQVGDWDFGLTDAQKNTAIQYRTSLRQIKSQPGYPYNVTFPIEPDFITATNN